MSAYRAQCSPEANVVRFTDFDEAYTELARAGKADWLPTPAP